MDDPVKIACVAALTADFLWLGINAGPSAILADRNREASSLRHYSILKTKVCKTSAAVFKEPTTALELIKPSKIFDSIDDWLEHLALYDGQGACPLAYVIQDIIPIPTHGVDLPFGSVQSFYAS
jgi:hypothetical protein